VCSGTCRFCLAVVLVVFAVGLARPASGSARTLTSDVVSGPLSAVPASVIGRVAGLPVLPFAQTARRRPRPWYSFAPSTFVASESVFGARLVGMVYDLNGSDQPVERCSGTVVDSPNGSVVWTAGHCIFNRALSPQPFPHILFLPGAVAGSEPLVPAAPYGVWTAVAYAMTADWARHGSARHWRRDLGALLIARNAEGETIRQALGGADRISFRGTSGVRTEVLGYPGAGRFAGNESLIGCGPYPTGRYPFAGGRGPDPLEISCGMTSGASGGPWLTHVNAAGVGTVISATSSANGPVNGPTTRLFGAVQSGVARRVWARLARLPVP
jgi:hypothetical protein